MKKMLCTFMLLVLPMMSFAFVEGKDYQRINASDQSGTVNHQVQVTEFFSYGCPWCYRLQPHLEKWQKTKPSNVDFKRVPVVYHENWTILARAYYVANALGVADKLTPALFAAVQKDNKDLSSDAAMEAFFVEHGVKKEDFQRAFSASPSIDLQMHKGDRLMKDYKIFSIPTIVVDGKYTTDLQLVEGDVEKFIHVINYLIEKESASHES